ncbi:MAG: hypothetical protein ABIP55_01645, partial [Tepidisphaeraceae bacterium]
LIRSDLMKLRDDDQLHACIAEEFGRLHGSRVDAQQQNQRRLADLDQQAVKLREHLLAMDTKAAQALGLYDQAQRVAEEKESLERQIIEQPTVKVPSPSEVRAQAASLFVRLEAVIAGGTIEEQRQFVALYVHRIEADPKSQRVKISLYPPMFNRESPVLRPCQCLVS